MIMIYLHILKYNIKLQGLRTNIYLAIKPAKDLKSNACASETQHAALTYNILLIVSFRRLEN